MKVAGILNQLVGLVIELVVQRLGDSLRGVLDRECHLGVRHLVNLFLRPADF
ncbi:hypothetical protein SDC9_130005 [bioreactor metagenome]|uniref:Uncharacterized protein n=1 Tax=bioreactor metagenome TaxID=1076179 RepID=A0A645D1I2_9ZZZZ